MIVIPGNREHARLGFEPRQRVAERTEITAHRIGTGKVIARQENQLRLLAVEHFDRELEPLDVFIAVEMKIADLARDDSLKRQRQAAHRELDFRDLDFVDRPAPHPMQRAKRERRLSFGFAGRRVERLG